MGKRAVRRIVLLGSPRRLLQVFAPDTADARSHTGGHEVQPPRKKKLSDALQGSSSEVCDRAVCQLPGSSAEKRASHHIVPESVEACDNTSGHLPEPSEGKRAKRKLK